MKKIKFLILALILALLAAGSVWAATPKSQTTCPVLGGEINKQYYADYKGQRIYFCCGACVEPFKKEPEKYLKKLEEQGVTPEKAPAGPEKK